MGNRTYERWAPGGNAAATVVRANRIINEYAAQGFSLTLRQLYYQFVARDFIVNSDRSYKNLGAIINRARMAGLIDWLAIEDRTRNLARLGHWGSPAEIIQSAARGFHMDMWEDQPVRVEVWVEKEALAGVIQGPADRWDCAWFSCRGYVSQSEQWRAARRILRYIEGGQRVVILHLGDHDPSGIDMTRDIRERITHFICVDWDGGLLDDPPDYDYIFEEMADSIAEHQQLDKIDRYGLAPFEVRRIALNWDQIQEFNPPPNPAKMTDSRASGYVSEYGRQSWELDALSPSTLAGLIDNEITDLVDAERFAAREAEVEQLRTNLTALAERPWEEVEAWLNS